MVSAFFVKKGSDPVMKVKHLSLLRHKEREPCFPDEKKKKKKKSQMRRF